MHLSPPHARDLGAFLAQTAIDRDAQFIVATQSADLLAGVLQTSHRDATLIRLTRTQVGNRAHVLEGDELAAFMTHPRARGSELLSAAFYPSVVVCEADADAQFYHSAARRAKMLRAAQFVAGAGIATLAALAGSYRVLGVPTVVLTDFDIFQGGSRATLAAIVAALTSDSLQKDRIIAACTNLDAAALKTGLGWKQLKNQGIAGLTGDAVAVAEEAMAQCRAIGLIIAPVGELEDWLPHLPARAKGDKSGWIREAFSDDRDQTPPPELIQFLRTAENILLEQQDRYAEQPRLVEPPNYVLGAGEEDEGSI